MNVDLFYGPSYFVLTFSCHTRKKNEQTFVRLISKQEKNENVKRSSTIGRYTYNIHVRKNVCLVRSRQRTTTSFCGKTINHLPSINRERKFFTKLKQVVCIPQSKYSCEWRVWQNLTKLKLEKKIFIPIHLSSF